MKNPSPREKKKLAVTFLGDYYVVAEPGSLLYEASQIAVQVFKDKLREKIDETIGEIADDGFKSYQDGWEDALKHVLKLLDEGEG